MRDSLIDLLIANFFIGISFLAESTFAKFGLIFLGFIWFIGYMIFSRMELKTLKSESKLERLKADLNQKRFTILLQAIDTMINLMQLNRRKKIRRKRKK